MTEDQMKERIRILEIILKPPPFYDKALTQGYERELKILKHQLILNKKLTIIADKIAKNLENLQDL
jgi:hypothetical protein